MRANEHRLNRLARQMLVKLGRKPDARIVHAVELMSWALDEDVIRRTDVDLKLVREAVETMAGAPHSRVMSILRLSDDAPGKPGLQPRHILDKSPREVASALLVDFSEKLAEAASSERRTVSAEPGQIDHPADTSTID